MGVESSPVEGGQREKEQVREDVNVWHFKFLTVENKLLMLTLAEKLKGILSLLRAAMKMCEK